MAEKKRVLFVTQEMKPYTDLSIISEIVRKIPQYVQEQGMEIRVLMPRFGTINERRHRLHEVVRLSGMNIIVDDDDYPLVIKVASLPGARMQVYFLDNEDFFRRKQVFEDKNGKPFSDNIDRMVFFCKGVIETVKKFGWAPDIVHCHGWMTSLVPAYLKTVYKNEPIFQNAKVIFSQYVNNIEKNFEPNFFEKATINNLTDEDLSPYMIDGSLNLNSGAASFSDGVIIGDEDLTLVEDGDKPGLGFQDPTEDFMPSYLDFYQMFIPEETT